MPILARAFSREAWSRNAGLYEAIRTMPFNAELAAGVLSGRGSGTTSPRTLTTSSGSGAPLALAAAKAPNPDRIVQFAKAAEVAIVVERALHGSFFAQFAITPERSRGRPCRRPAIIMFAIFSPPPMPNPTRSFSGLFCRASGSTPRLGGTFMPGL